MEVCILVSRLRKKSSLRFEGRAMKRQRREPQRESRSTGACAQLELGLRPKGKRRKTKLKFKRKTSLKKQTKKKNTRTLFALSPNLPYVGKDYVHITSVDCNQVGHDESAGGPHDQERRQEAETLRAPKHLERKMMMMMMWTLQGAARHAS